MTLANDSHRTERRRRELFYLGMALAITGTVVCGFTLNAARGHFDVAALPPLIHLHAGLCMVWIGLFVAQSGLVVAGSVARHRAMGWVGAALAVALVGTGVAVTVGCLRRGAVPPFFPPSLFLVVDVLGVLAFFGLTVGAIALRRRSDWHRRLMISGTIILMSPAVARILPMPLLGPLGGGMVTGVLLVFALGGAAHDFLTRRRIHPGWFVGALTIVVLQLLATPIAFSEPVMALTARLSGPH